MTRRAILLAFLGALIGTWSTLCGIGGGIFAVPLLHYLLGVELRAAVASSLLLVVASTTAATTVELLREDTALHLQTFAVLTAASLAGTRAGYFVAARIGTRTLKGVFGIVLAGVGLRILLADAPANAATSVPAGLALATSEYAIVAAVGFAAGFVAPLLGIGGGLVAVPGMLFGAPALGYGVARACSTAMSVLNSAQSLWLYRRDGLFELALALPLAAGALAGGVAGDALIHEPAIVAVAQRLLAFTLILAAARFAWDLRAPPAPPVAGR